MVLEFWFSDGVQGLGVEALGLARVGSCLQPEAVKPKPETISPGPKPPTQDRFRTPNPTTSNRES